MTKEKEIVAISETFDFATVPSWYVICTNSSCPLRDDCMRFYAGSHAPDSLETATCVMPATLKDGQCRWMDEKRTVVVAYGFSHLYEQVLKHDFTPMRERITDYLHGPKMYYEYMRGERPLSPQQQHRIQKVVRDFGYSWEVPFDRYAEAYVFDTAPSNR